MPSIAALEPNKLFMMSENGVDECFDSNVFMRFHIRALLFVQVFEYCGDQYGQCSSRTT
jgi:hypothetical protein